MIENILKLYEWLHLCNNDIRIVTDKIIIKPLSDAPGANP